MVMHLARLHDADPGGPCRVVVNSGLLALVNTVINGVLA